MAKNRDFFMKGKIFKSSKQLQRKRRDQSRLPVKPVVLSCRPLPPGGDDALLQYSGGTPSRFLTFSCPGDEGLSRPAFGATRVFKAGTPSQEYLPGLMISRSFTLPDVFIRSRVVNLPHDFAARPLLSDHMEVALTRSPTLE